MKEKEIRIKQLNDLKSGIFSGTYIVEVRHFDGRLIERKTFSEKANCIDDYYHQMSKYRGYATINKYVMFDF